MNEFNINLKKIGTSWYAKATTDNPEYLVMGASYEENDSMAIIEALTAVGRAIASNKLTRETIKNNE